MQGADCVAQGVHLRFDQHRGDADRGDGAGARAGDGAGPAQEAVSLKSLFLEGVNKTLG